MAIHSNNDAAAQEALYPILTEAQIACAAQHGETIHVNTGEVLFAEGRPAEFFYVLLEGQVRVTKDVAGEATLITIHQPGEFTGEVSLLGDAVSVASGTTASPCRLLKLGRDEFKALLSECEGIADTVLPAMAQRRPDALALSQQREKLTALGKMSAGLAHELNNPAAAAGRAAAQMRDTLTTLQTLALAVGTSGLDAAQRAGLAQFAQDASTGAQNALPGDTLARSDQEESVADWLEAHHVDDPWCLAPALVEAGIGIPRLDDLAAHIGPDALPPVVAWLEANLSAAGLLREIEQSMGRISDLVKAIKSYSYMDQAATQEVDVREGLENTLTMLGHKLKHTQITVTRQYDPALPCITAHGGELNQVWTNLLDNAIDALGSAGHIILYASHENDSVLVEVEDDGPGIPAAIQNRIFEPFFTTKGVGEGTGLGLDTSYRIVVQRHHGDICFDSEPGRTRFQVRLPISTDPH